MTTILDALQDPKLFASHFPATEWAPWFSVLAGVYGLPNPDPQFFIEHTGRQPPTSPCRTFLAVSGRRSGKSRVASLLAVWAACFRDYRRVLAPGEWADILLFAVDKDQAGILASYIGALLDSVPLLAKRVIKRTKDTITLKGRVRIQVKPSEGHRIRGRSVALAVLDEAAFLRSADESTLSAEELVTALQPSLATIPGSMLVAIRSPYARRRWFHDVYAKSYGKDGETLVWVSATRDMNPSVPQALIDAALEADPAHAAAEWLGQFRRDVEGWLSPEALAQCVVPNRVELPPQPNTHYVRAIDPSGGSQDSMTCAVAHFDQARGVVVLDAVREVRPPFSPEAVCQDFAALLTSYHCHQAVADRWGGVWVVEPMQKLGVTVEQNAAPKSDVYRDALPLLNSNRVELLDMPRLHSQLLSLERRTARGGKDSVDHPPGANWKDDVANASMLACVAAQGAGEPIIASRNLASSAVRSNAAVLTYEDEFREMDRQDHQLRGFPRPNPNGIRRYGS